MDHQGFAIATLNLDHAVKLATDGEFARAYSCHEMVVADGRPIVWLLRLARRPVALSPGSEMIRPLCRMARDMGLPVGFVGSTRDVLQKAAQQLETEIPGLKICVRIAPSRRFDPHGPEARGTLVELQKSGAKLCFLALGAPKQEVFAVAGRAALPEAGFVSIGAGLDFIAGAQIRAPRWVRLLALEWLWRIAREPRRMAPRYVRCFAVLPRLTRDALLSRTQSAP